MRRLFLTTWFYSLIFGLFVFLFFAFIYPYHLHYQEQFQMFLFSDDYLLQYLSKPGGLSDYLGNFFTQFFFYSQIGAIILAFLLVFLQRLVWEISLLMGVDKRFFVLSFIPSIFYLGLLCDESYLTGGLVSILLITSAILVYSRINKSRWKMGYFFIVMPLLYWVAGGLFILLFLFAVIRELKVRQMKSLWLITFILSGLIISVGFPLICKYFFLQYPLAKAFVGVNYYRYPVNLPYLIGVTGILIVLIPYITAFLSKTFKGISRFAILTPVVIVIVGSGFFIQALADMDKENIMEYDFYARMRKWDEIIQKAGDKAPKTPLSVTCLNLALAKNDQLGERMFEFYQKGTGGLIPDFRKDYTILLIAGEVYYHLGFFNTAQRSAFKAMEALSDYQKSFRGLKRLTEKATIKGNYDVVEKYLGILQQTIFYRVWALRISENLEDEDFIEQHPEWGLLRSLSLKEDFLFSGKEKDMMLGILFTDNRRHRMAFEYLLAYTLLEGNLQNFVRYFPLNESIGYRNIPKHFQEALLLAWDFSKEKQVQNIPYSIDSNVMKSFQEFKTMYRNNIGKNKMRELFSDTYWYYYFYRK